MWHNINIYMCRYVIMYYICGPFCGSSSVGRASAFQAEGREFESRLPLFFNGTADVAQG